MDRPDGSVAPLEKASLLSKLIVLPGLVFSTAVMVLLIIQFRHDSTKLYVYVSEPQNVVTSSLVPALVHSVQQFIGVEVLIQLLAHVLGFVHIFTMSTIANFSTRLRFGDGNFSISLIELRLWQSISSNQLVWNLPFLQLGVLLSYFVLHLLPSTLWAGALTPIPSSMVISGSIHLPAYPPDPMNMFWNRSREIDPARNVIIHSDVGSVRNEKGVFSYGTSLLQGQIFTAASAASTVRGDIVKPKNDLSRLAYLGRSYGVGTSAGLEDPLVGSTGQRTPVLLYSYQEEGYKTDVQCSKNDSSAWRISQYTQGNGASTPDMYLAAGMLPNSAYDPTYRLDWDFPGYIPGFYPEWYVTIGFGDEDIVALVVVSNALRNMVSIATGNGTYDVLNNIQCDVHFTPYMFDISVNMTSSLITVNPLANSSDIDPSSADYGAGCGIIPRTILGGINSFSQMNTDLYTSVLGNVFLSNLADISNGRNTSSTNVSVILEGIETSLESMLDDLLVGFGSAQLEIAGKNASAKNSTISSDTKVTVAAMRMGKLRYLAAIIALNSLLVLAYLAECGRTRNWRGMPLFDHNDIASVIVAASKGGPVLGNAVLEAHKAKGTKWFGNPGDMGGGHAKMRLVWKEMPIIEGEEPDNQTMPLMSDAS